MAELIGEYFKVFVKRRGGLGDFVILLSDYWVKSCRGLVVFEDLRLGFFLAVERKSFGEIVDDNLVSAGGER
jgi:hypothetical protein